MALKQSFRVKEALLNGFYPSNVKDCYIICVHVYYNQHQSNQTEPRIFCQSIKHARLCFFCKLVTPLFCRRYFLNSVFFCMKVIIFRLKFHYSLFLRAHLTIRQYLFRKWICAEQATSHYLDQWWFIFLMRKSRTYVYVMRQYKGLAIKKLFQNKILW